jgi:putative lipase involved disintegration of autophagic bodies
LEGKTAAADLATDAALALGFGENTSRFRNAAKLAKAVQDKYSGYSFESTGHSLGGSIAKSLHDNLDFPRDGVFRPPPNDANLATSFSNKNEQC